MAMIYVGQLQAAVIYFKRNETLEETQWSFSNNGALMAIYCKQGVIC